MAQSLLCPPLNYIYVPCFLLAHLILVYTLPTFARTIHAVIVPYPSSATQAAGEDIQEAVYSVVDDKVGDKSNHSDGQSRVKATQLVMPNKENTTDSGQKDKEERSDVIEVKATPLPILDYQPVDPTRIGWWRSKHALKNLEAYIKVQEGQKRAHQADIDLAKTLHRKLQIQKELDHETLELQNRLDDAKRKGIQSSQRDKNELLELEKKGLELEIEIAQLEKKLVALHNPPQLPEPKQSQKKKPEDELEELYEDWEKEQEKMREKGWDETHLVWKQKQRLYENRVQSVLRSDR